MAAKMTTDALLRKCEKRGSPRVRTDVPIKYRVMRRPESRAGLCRGETYQHGRLADISASGMCLEVPDSLRAGQTVEVYVPPTSNGAANGAQGLLSIVSVVRAQQSLDQWLAGVRFEDRSNLF